MDEGRLGRIFHYRANFLQDWTISSDLPQGGAALWLLDVAAAGSGVTGDLLAHCIDTALWLNGDITTVCAMTETFIKERKHNLTGKIELVGLDDACAFLCPFENGSLGLFESTCYARGHKALYTFEINGEKASLKWDLHDLHRLQYFDHRDDGIVRGWRSVHVTEGDHPYMKHWWVPGLQIGYEHTFVHQVTDFLQGLPTASHQPDLPQGAGHPGRLRRRPRLGRGRQVAGCRPCLIRDGAPQDRQVLERRRFRRGDRFVRVGDHPCPCLGEGLEDTRHRTGRLGIVLVGLEVGRLRWLRDDRGVRTRPARPGRRNACLARSLPQRARPLPRGPWRTPSLQIWR